MPAIEPVSCSKRRVEHVTDHPAVVVLPPPRLHRVVDADLEGGRVVVLAYVLRERLLAPRNGGEVRGALAGVRSAGLIGQVKDPRDLNVVRLGAVDDRHREHHQLPVFEVRLIQTLAGDQLVEVEHLGAHGGTGVWLQGGDGGRTRGAGRRLVGVIAGAGAGPHPRAGGQSGGHQRAGHDQGPRSVAARGSGPEWRRRRREGRASVLLGCGSAGPGHLATSRARVVCPWCERRADDAGEPCAWTGT